MKLITANLLNRLWKNGIKPIKDTVDVIKSNYIKGLSVSERTITYTKGNGTTGSIATTWRGIQNNLTSTSTSDSLAAAQGKALNDRITQLNTNLAAVSNNYKGTVIISNQNQTVSAKYTKNYVLNEGNYILTASTSAGIGCYLLTVISNSVYWTQMTVLPSQVSLAKSGLTVGVTYEKGASGIISLIRI